MLFLRLTLILLLWSGWFIGGYFGAFSVCLSDDVDFYHGKTRMKNRRKKTKGFWKKFLFLDIRKEVVLWHYVLFWIYLISSLIALIALEFHVVFNNTATRVSTLISFGVSFLSLIIINNVRWSLYARNKVRSKKEYRKNKR